MFKKDDEVRVIGASNINGDKSDTRKNKYIGSTFKIERLLKTTDSWEKRAYDKGYRYVLAGGDFFKESEIESIKQSKMSKAKYKVGDKVKVLAYSEIYKGSFISELKKETVGQVHPITALITPQSDKRAYENGFRYTINHNFFKESEVELEEPIEPRVDISVGDKVKVIKTNIPKKYKVGETGEVEKVVPNYDGTKKYQLKGDESYYYLNGEIERVQETNKKQMTKNKVIAVGSKVKVIDNKRSNSRELKSLAVGTLVKVTEVKKSMGMKNNETWFKLEGSPNEYYREKQVELVTSPRRKSPAKKVEPVVIKTPAQLAYDNLSLKVGDKVEVLFSLPNNKRDILGWNHFWVNGQNDTVGQVYTISELIPDYSAVRFKERGGIFPVLVLEKAKVVEFELTKKAKVEVTKNAATINGETLDIEKLKELVKLIEKF